MDRVFVVNEPMKRDPRTGEWAPIINVEHAQRFGELVHLLPAGRLPQNLQVTVDALDRGLVDFTATDYLLPVGDVMAVGFAIALAARRTGGEVQLLRWLRDDRAYAVRRARLPGFADG